MFPSRGSGTGPGGKVLFFRPTINFLRIIMTKEETVMQVGIARGESTKEIILMQ